MEWNELPDKKASRIICQKMDVNLKDKNDYEICFDWFKVNVEKYIRVIPKYF